MTTDAPPSPVAAPHKIPVETTGYYYIDEVSPPAGSAPALLGLHGYGQTAPDFLDVLRKWTPPEFLAVAGQGFHQIWDRETRKIAFSWMTAFEKADNIMRNNRFVESLANELRAAGKLDGQGMFLLGFSQGSSVAYRFAQRHPELARGIISVCADLPPDVEQHLAPLKKIPVLILYGLRDPIFPVEKSLHAAEALRAAGVDVEIVSFDRGHIMPSSLGEKVQDWLRRHRD